MIYYALALVFGIVHYFWASRIRGSVAEYMANRVHGLEQMWVYQLQNWLVRVFLPIIIVLSHGDTPEALGFRFPKLTVDTLILLILLTVAVFLIIVVILRFAVSYVEDTKAIETVKGWSTEYNWKGRLIGALTGTIPEECFFRGYLVSQFLGLGPIAALSVTAFFTAIAHDYRGKFWIMLSIFTGLFAGLAFIWTESLLPPLITHVIINNIPVPWMRSLIMKSSVKQTG